MPASASRQPLVAVLAAGRASRFGGGKLDAPLAGKPLGKWALDAAENAGIAPGLIIAGPDAPGFAKDAPDWQLVINSDRDEGQGTSVALACREAARQKLGILLMLADMPLVSSDHLRKLLASPVNAATRYPDGRLGVPVKLVAGDVGKFAQLSGDTGLGRYLSELEDLDTIDAPAERLRDVDDAAGLEEVRAIMAGRV